MDDIKYLLQKISLVRDKSAIRESQEEHFNVFTTLLPYDDEVYLHSRFISSILDPKGSHKLGDLFLRLFLSILNSSFVYGLSSLEVIPSSSTWTEYKEIDILLIDRKKHYAVIIENKINAHDSNHTDEGQLERYYRRLIEEDEIPAENIEVYYLRPHRNTAPSKDSVSKSGRFKELPNKVQLISYEQEIAKWVTMCIKESANFPYIRETLNQYLNLINTMTNNSDIQESLDLIEAISTSEDTLRSAKTLIDNFCNMQFHTIKNFFNDLYVELENRNYKVLDNVSEDIIENLVYGGPQKRKVDVTFTFSNNKGYIFTIGSDCDDALYFGICNDDNKGKLKEVHSLISTNKEKVDALRNEKIKSQKNWAFWCYFDVKEENYIFLWDFKQQGTFDLIRKENRKRSINLHLDDFEKTISVLLK